MPRKFPHRPDDVFPNHLFLSNVGEPKSTVPSSILLPADGSDAQSGRLLLSPVSFVVG